MIYNPNRCCKQVNSGNFQKKSNDWYPLHNTGNAIELWFLLGTTSCPLNNKSVNRISKEVVCKVSATCRLNNKIQFSFVIEFSELYEVVLSIILLIEIIQPMLNGLVNSIESWIIGNLNAVRYLLKFFHPVWKVWNTGNQKFVVCRRILNFYTNSFLTSPIQVFSITKNLIRLLENKLKFCSSLWI